MVYAGTKGRLDQATTEFGSFTGFEHVPDVKIALVADLTRDYGPERGMRLLDAIKDTFTMTLQLLATCINRLALRELENIHERDSVVEEILKWVTNALTEPEFHQSIEAIWNRPKADSNFETQLGV